MTRFLVAILAWVLANAAAANEYRWVDAGGRVHYSDAAPQPRGLEFGKYLSLRRGMTEGELLAVAGEPDLRRSRRATDIYTYMPTAADPFVTTVTLVRGRVHDIERERKF